MRIPMIAALLATACSAEAPADKPARESEVSAESTWGAPKVLPLSGDLRTHDPALIRAGSSWYVFSTGDPAVANGTIQIRRSRDLLAWTYAGNVGVEIPAWARAKVPTVTNLWAPEIHYRNNLYYLYYSVSSFGSNNSAIGLATNVTLDPADARYAWTDQGLVHESTSANDYNAIDPAVVDDGSGTPYLAMGSFWSGIRMLRLQWPSGKVAPGQGEPLRLVDRFVPPNAVEGANILRHDGKYYMFVAFDFCCQGTNSTYKIAVGRSDVVTGPYYDRLGTPLQHGGGTVILSENGTMFGPGGPDAFPGHLVYHWYDAAAGGDFRLGIRTIRWENGWPTVAAATDEQF